MNPHRGEVCLRVDGQDLPLRLTLGALAELEDTLKAESLADMLTRYETGDMRASDLVALLGAGLRACGWQGTDADLASARIAGGPLEAARVAARLLKLAFSGV